MAILELHLYDGANTTHLARLENATGIEYLAQLNDVGRGSFSLPATDSKASLVAAGTAARLRIDNEDVGAFLIEAVDHDITGGVITAAGRGLLAGLEAAIIWPEDAGDYQTIERVYLAKTPGFMIIDQLDEADARGVTVPAVDFDATNDSGATAWPDSWTLSYKAGQTLLDMARQHVDLGVEITTTPAGVLQYWTEAGADLSGSIRFRQGLNVVKASRRTDRSNLVNAILSGGQYALSERTDGTSISAYGRRERAITFGNAYDNTALNDLGDLALADLKDPAIAIELEVIPDPAPFVAYGLGDTVRAILPGDGINAGYRVRAITIKGEQGDAFMVGLGLNSLFDEYMIKLDRTIRRRFLAPVDTAQSANTDPNVGGWQLGRDYLRYEGGTAATSAGLAPTDYPFYAGEVYANRASAPFRVSNAGVLTATGANISGTITATAGSIGGWTINSTYLAKDTGTAATSAGLAPTDYPFYAGATYSGRESAPFRVTPAGVLTATNATITGTVNWGAGQGVLNATGLSFVQATNREVKIDATSNDGLLRVKQSSASARAADFYQYGNADGVWITTVGTGRGLVVASAYDAAIEAFGDTVPAIEGHGNGGGVWGWVVGGSGRYGVIAESLLNGGTPLKVVNPATSSGMQFMWFKGVAANGSVSSTIVEESAVSTATRQGFLAVYVEDDGNQITDQRYFIPIYTLA